MKVDSDVLLLSYLDKICLTLTGDCGALWRVYIVKQGHIREPERRLSLSRLHCILQATSLCDGGSRPQKHMWNNKALFFPAQIYCCTIVYISNILWRLKVKSFKTPTVKEEASSVLFILTANEHTQTGTWLQIVEVAIIPVRVSVQ